MAISSLDNLEEHTIDHEALGVKAQSVLDSRYVNVTGDTMTGGLLIQPSTDSASALVVKDQDSNIVFNVDTVANKIGIGIAPTSNTSLVETLTGVTTISSDISNEYNVVNFSAPCSSSYRSFYGKRIRILTPADSTAYSRLTVNVLSAGFDHYGSGNVQQVRGLYMPIFNNGDGSIGICEGGRFTSVAAGGSVTTLKGFYSQSTGNATTKNATISNGYACYGQTTALSLGTYSMSVTNLYNFYADSIFYELGTSTCTVGNAYYYYVATQAVLGTPQITNQYGLYVNTLNAATNNWAIYTNGGLNRLGDQLAIVGSADRVQLKLTANATQTTNIQEWETSIGVTLAYVDPSGNIVIDSDSYGLKLGADQDVLLSSDGAGKLILTPAADTDVTLSFVGTTTSGEFKWMEDEDYFQFNDDIMLTGGENIILDTTTGTKIGTATNQLLGFYNAVPVDQPATVGDAVTQDLTGIDLIDRVKTEADLTSCKNAINAIIDRLQELGLIA